MTYRQIMHATQHARVDEEEPTAIPSGPASKLTLKIQHPQHTMPVISDKRV
jgi:hypothetical protein